MLSGCFASFPKENIEYRITRPEAIEVANPMAGWCIEEWRYAPRRFEDRGGAFFNRQPPIVNRQFISLPVLIPIENMSQIYDI
jgi:hypothetical protein